MTAEEYVPRVWPGTYRLPSDRLRVPAAAVEFTLDTFAGYAADHVESACFWYGLRDESGASTVEAVVVTEQINHSRWYDIPADAMAAVFEATAGRDWRNLCQLHTHPGPYFEHSFYDDEHANSRRALSLVLAQYGREPGWPAQLGVHEFQDGSWHLLDGEQAQARIVYDHPGPCELIDLR